MAVYVDDFNHPFGRMLMCHMVADTTKELLDMVDKIGVQRKWIQYKGSRHEHFDICLSKKAKAINHGAISISYMALGRMTWERKTCNDKLKFKRSYAKS